jgi:hypothetical protein
MRGIECGIEISVLRIQAVRRKTKTIEVKDQDAFIVEKVKGSGKTEINNTKNMMS